MERDTVLEIEFKEVWDNKWAWKIIKNEVDFKNTGGEIPFNNIKITCANKEDLYVFDNWLVEWGLIDDYSLIDSNLKTDIQDFINYINEKYGTLKRWRAKIHETYYIINDLGYIISCIDEFTQTDSTYYNLGNYFKSTELAIKFRDTLWKNIFNKIKELNID